MNSKIDEPSELPSSSSCCGVGVVYWCDLEVGEHGLINGDDPSGWCIERVIAERFAPELLQFHTNVD